ncbi:MAG: B12-binding domain-containing protein [Thermotogota bacterium]
MISRSKFTDFIAKGEKERLIDCLIDSLDKKEVTVRELYKERILPSIEDFECPFQEDPLCIWKEHVRTSITRTVIEVIYPYLLKERKPFNGKKIIMTCPSEEYHELPLRVVSDWFELNGFNTIFAGGNTPLNALLLAVDYEKPDYLGLSVSNPYNLYRAQNIIEAIRQKDKSVGIVVGGRAFNKNNAFVEKMNYDVYLKNINDIDAFTDSLSDSSKNQKDGE